MAWLSHKKVVEDAGEDFKNALNGMIKWFDNYNNANVHVLFSIVKYKHWEILTDRQL